MKKFICALAILFFSVAIFSCSKSKSDNQASIVGKWIFISSYINAGFRDSTITSTNGATSWEYKSDGTKVSIDSTGATSTSTYNYNSSTKVLVEKGSDTTLTFNVVTLTNTNLQLHTEGTINYGFPLQIKADLYFKR